MKRVGYGKTHKLKGSMQMGLWYPVLREELIPGDIIRVNPEVFIQSVIPPVTQLTDKISYKIEFGFVPNRLVDDTFVKNITTSKDGTVKGNFKTWSFAQIADGYGEKHSGNSAPRRLTGTPDQYQGIMARIPDNFKEYNKMPSVAQYSMHKVSDNNGLRNVCFKNASTGLKDYEYNEVLPYAVKNGVNDYTEGSEDRKVMTSPFFGQGSLFDWLSIEPNANVGINGSNSDNVGKADFTFNTFAISSYYMLMNFWHTKPEYEKYIAPYFDYVYAGRDNTENRTTLHRYETLEEEFGNGFEEPRLSGRCYNGLCIDNWVDDYFAKTMKTPQRGVAPVVPVAFTGTVPSFGVPGLNSKFRDEFGEVVSKSSDAIMIDTDAEGNLTRSSGTLVTDEYEVPSQSMSGTGGFVISDLRSALALQHFQEDTQDCFKWSDWLQKVFGISPSDNTLDEPAFVGACSGILASDSVIATADTDNATLGSIGGSLGVKSSHRRFTYKAEEHGTFMAIMVIKPERNYESGVDKMFLRKNYLDMYFKYLTGIGNQAISLQELCAIPRKFSGNINRDSNWGFTSRFEEFRHSKNRIVSKCRNNNIVVPCLKASGGVISIDSYGTIQDMRDKNADVPYLNTFHPYAIGDAYVADAIPYTLGGYGLNFTENCQNFLLCLPQLNDIFVDDTEEPLLTVIGFNMDILSPIPAFTKPGVPYV